MKNKLAKLEYLPNNFKILEEGDHVICAVSKKIIKLEELNYWNVELQEAYYSYKEAFIKNETIESITNQLNNWLEKMISIKPNQWIWSHNRWK